jgi:hypothetical protein
MEEEEEEEGVAECPECIVPLHLHISIEERRARRHGEMYHYRYS